MADPLVNSVLHEIDEETPLIYQPPGSDPARLHHKKKPRRKYLCCCLIILAILALIVGISVPAIVYAVIPNYVRSQVKTADLNVHQIYFHSLYADSVGCQMNFSLSRLDYDFRFSEISVDLAHNGTKIGDFQLDQLSSYTNSTNTHILVESKDPFIHVFKNVTIRITDDKRFSLLLQDLLVRNATLSLSFVRYKLDVFGLPLVKSLTFHDISFEKHFSIKTFDQFNPVKVDDIHVEKIERRDSLKFWISLKMQLSNPSILGFYLNFYSFKLSFLMSNDEYVPIGIIGVDELDVKPNSTVTKNAYLSLSSEYFQTAEAVSSFLTRIIKHENIDILVQSFGHSRNSLPSSSLFFSPHFEAPGIELKWLEKGMRNLTIPLVLDTYPRYDIFISSISVDSLDIKMEKEFAPFLSGSISARVLIPREFKDIDVPFTKLKFSICYFDNGDYCEPVGTVETGLNPSILGEWNYNDDTRNLKIELNPDFDSESTLKPSDLSVYKQFIRKLTVSDRVKIRIEGKASAMIDAVGDYAHGSNDEVMVHDIGFSQIVNLEGMDLPNQPRNQVMFLQNLDVYKVNLDNGLELEMPGSWMKRLGKTGNQVGLIVQNPLVFRLMYTEEGSENKADVGRVTLPDLHLSESSACKSNFNHTLKNVTFNTPVPYCKINPSAVFKSSVVHDAEICSGFMECPGRSFISHYMTGYTLLHKPARISLEASSLPADFEFAKDVMVVNTQLEGYIPSVDPNQAPFNFVKAIIIKASTLPALLTGRLDCWLEFYNPLSVPIRYFYINVETFLKGSLIGTLNINMTLYDPFEKKPEYVFKGYKERKWLEEGDEYGPHPSKKCIDSNNCQIYPIFLPASTNDTITTQRMEVFFNPSLRLIELWQALFTSHVNTTVSIKGTVLASIGAPASDKPEDTHKEPPVHDNQFVTWIDYGQENTPLRLYLKPE